MFARGTLLLWLALSAASCVSYTPDTADPVAIATEVRQRRGGTFTFEAAVLAAFRQNADLRALAARARAAGAVVEPTELQVEWRSDSDMVAVMLDPIAMLGFGVRGAANQQASAEASAAAQMLAAGRWRVAAALAEVWAVDQALATLAVPTFAIDADAWQRAGLASRLAADQARAATARAHAERLELTSARAAVLADFRRLLGLPDHADVDLVPTDPDWLRQPSPSDAALLARPDVAIAAAAFQVADGAFRRAVWEQFPSLMIGPDIPLMGGALQTMAVLRLPIAAHGRALAAREQRDAARAELEAACLEASREASRAEAELAAADANVQATAAGLTASEGMLAAALVEVQTEGEAFERAASAANMAMRDTMERRQAVIHFARARVQRAVAWGWPVVAPAPEAP